MPIPTEQYKLSLLDGARQDIRRLGETARSCGMQKEFLAALAEIDRHLKTRPLDWGDPQFSYHFLDRILRHGIHPPLHVFYGVHQVQRVVIVKEVLALPGSALAEQ